MGLITAQFIMQQVSWALIEPQFRTPVNPAGPAIVPGVQVVTPGNMRYIFSGVMVVVGGANPEAVLVISTTATTFTAAFANAHANTDPVTGPTFPSGQPDMPLWTQSEMLNYLVSVQNDFLAEVRPIYKIATQALTVGIAAYTQPADAIRIERISIAGVELWDTTQTDIDWQGGYSSRASTSPQYWFQDKLGAFKYGVDPVPQVGATARLFYSQSGAATLGLLDTLTVPDLFWPAMKAGVLALAWSKDGEQRDLQRSAYCQKRFEFWCLLASKFINGMEARFVGPEETVEPLLSTMRS